VPIIPFNKSGITMRTTKLWFLTLSLGLTASCLLWGGRGIGATETTVRSEALAARPAELDDTEPLVSQKGRFRFPFPAKPQEMDQKIDTATGPSVIHSALHEARRWLYQAGVRLAWVLNEAFPEK
jgi:hypothetical protein